MSDNVEATLTALIKRNVGALEDGAELLEMLSAEQFTQNCEPLFQSNIGVHFRHLIEHYSCFLEQWQTGCVSYDQRCRDLRLEMDISYTKKTIVPLCRKLNQFDAFNNRPKSLRVTDQPFAQAVESGLERELLFLLSHTVHHYAMIAAMARSLGSMPKDGFGLATATQIHLSNMASN